MATKDGSKEAFPALQSVTMFPDRTRTVAMGAPGMTLREYAAVAIMAGMLSDPVSNAGAGPERVASDAVKAADALLAALEKTP